MRTIAILTALAFDALAAAAGLAGVVSACEGYAEGIAFAIVSVPPLMLTSLVVEWAAGTLGKPWR